MYRFYFFTHRRVDGRMKLFPLRGQTTYANHGSTSAPEIPVDTNIEVQMTLSDRNLVCSYANQEGEVVFGVKMEGSSRRQVRLMAYTDRNRIYYKASGIVPLLSAGNNEIETDPNAYNTNRDGVHVHPNEEMIREFHAYMRRVGAEGDPEATPASSTQEPSDDEFPVVTAGRMLKVQNIGNHLADNCTLRDRTKFVKYSISLLLDLMAMGGVHFTYNKQNGDARQAFGTLREDIIREINPEAFNDARGRDGSSNDDGAHVVYFDIQKRAWRSFCTEDFVVLVPRRISMQDCLSLAAGE